MSSWRLVGNSIARFEGDRIREWESATQGAVKISFGNPLGDIAGRPQFHTQTIECTRSTGVMRAVTWYFSGGVMQVMTLTQYATTTICIGIVLAGYRVRGPPLFLQWQVEPWGDTTPSLRDLTQAAGCVREYDIIAREPCGWDPKIVYPGDEMRAECGGEIIPTGIYIILPR